MGVEKFGNTDLGKVRINNEDSIVLEYIYDDGDILAVVIDGVGGNEGGEVAAALAGDAIKDYLFTYRNGERGTLLKEAVNEANNKIFQERLNKPELSNMSCVLTACLFEFSKKRFHLAHVGDTRLYQIADGEFKKLTHDHSFVGLREEMGSLSEIEAMEHPQRNMIERDVGSELHKISDEDFIETNTFDLPENFALLLCSDGLSDMLTSIEMIEVLRNNNSIERRVNGLIGAANDKGGNDNITVLLIENSPDYQVVPFTKIFPHKEEAPQLTPSETQDGIPAGEGPYTKNSTIAIHPGKKKTGTSSALIWIVVIIISIAIGWFGHQFLEEKIRKNILPASVKDTFFTQQPKAAIDTSIQARLDSFYMRTPKDTFNINKDTIYITKEIFISHNKTIWIQKKPLFIVNGGNINLTGMVIAADSCVIRNLRFKGFKDSINIIGKRNTIK